MYCKWKPFNKRKKKVFFGVPKYSSSFSQIDLETNFFLEIQLGNGFAQLKKFYGTYFRKRM